MKIYSIHLIILTDKLYSYIVLMLGTQMYIIIRLCEVFLLYNSMFIKLLPSHKAECQLGCYNEKWISESFYISGWIKFGLDKIFSPADCQVVVSDLTRWVPMLLLWAVGISQRVLEWVLGPLHLSSKTSTSLIFRRPWHCFGTGTSVS